MPPEGSGLNPAMGPALTFTASVSDRGAAAAGGGGGPGSPSPSSLHPPDEEEVDDGFRKDANEVLVRDGPGRLRELIEAAEPTPINGLYRFR